MFLDVDSEVDEPEGAGRLPEAPLLARVPPAEAMLRRLRVRQPGGLLQEALEEQPRHGGPRQSAKGLQETSAPAVTAGQVDDEGGVQRLHAASLLGGVPQAEGML